MKVSKKYTRFLIIWAVNSLAVYLANWFYPTNIVLGTYRLTPVMAVLITGFLITFIARGASAYLKKYVSQYLKGKLGMYVFYGLVNSVGVWLIARFAPATGLGISSFYWALVLGFVLSLTQWLTRQGLKAGKLQWEKIFSVRLKGLEPPTLCSEDRCSIQLSYRRSY